VSVAKNFDAPIKLLFPKSVAQADFSMLGLGDIVIPGIMVAIVLRYDLANNNGKVKYFKSCFVGYVVGITTTIFVMMTFKAAQPALLYIVPAVLLATFGHAWKDGDVEKLLYWSEEVEEGGDDKKTDGDGKGKKAAAAAEEEEPGRATARRRVRRD